MLRTHKLFWTPLLAAMAAAIAGCSAENSGGAADADGWVSLFDGETLAGWRGANGKPIGEQWQALGGILTLTGEGGGDIITDGRYENFELSLEWRVTPKGNSGIMYRVVDNEDAVWLSGLEYQVLDNASPDREQDSHTAASLYALYAPPEDFTLPVGEFNHARIIVDGDHIEHWLNGHKAVECTLWSEDFNRRLNASKFKDWKTFGREPKGHIALQDHGDVVSYRNIKIREL